MNDILSNEWQVVFFAGLSLVVALGAVACRSVRGDPLGERLVRRVILIALATLLLVTVAIFAFSWWVARGIRW